MQEAKMRVELLGRTKNARDIIYAAFRQCYYSGFVGDMWDKIVNNEISEEKKDKLIANVIESGHESPIEHVNFTFAIDGVSRDLTHQLVRHRLASYSQQSQRYTGKGVFEYVVPPSFRKVPEVESKYLEYLEYMIQTYDEISSKLKENGMDDASLEDARIVLPNGAATRIVMTMNCRSLYNLFSLRCCNRAQWQIRNLAYKILHICQIELPVVFGPHIGAKCDRLGYCPENEKFNCGRYPTLNQLLDKKD